MRARTKLAILGAGVLAVFSLAVFLVIRTEPPEPYYNGRSLSDWFHQRMQFKDADGKDAKVKFDEATDAIRHIGTNALPLLLHRIRSEEPSLGRIAEFVYHLPVIGNALWKRVVQPTTLASEAISIFYVLHEK